MKNSVFSLLTLLLLGLTLPSCQKEPTFEAQLIGKWASKKVTYGQIDGTTLYHYDITLESSKEFDMTETTPVGTVVRTGVWVNNNDTREVTLTFDDGTTTTKYDITYLDEAKMVAETVTNGTRFIIEFQK